VVGMPEGAMCCVAFSDWGIHRHGMVGSSTICLLHASQLANTVTWSKWLIRLYSSRCRANAMKIEIILLAAQ
jgi:hypothetical protein